MRVITQQVRQAYDHIAPIYEQHNSGSLPSRLQHLANLIIEQLGPSTDLLDIGCGTGRDMALFEQHGLHVTGVDIAANMLRFAKQRTAGHLIQSTMQQLPFHSACFDGAWCCASLLHIPKLEVPTVLQEIRRVVRHQGVVMVSVQEGDGEQWNGGYVDGVSRFFARYQADELLTLIQANGLSITDYAREPGERRNWLTLLCRT